MTGNGEGKFKVKLDASKYPGDRARLYIVGNALPGFIEKYRRSVPEGGIFGYPFSQFTGVIPLINLVGGTLSTDGYLLWVEQEKAESLRKAIQYQINR